MDPISLSGTWDFRFDDEHGWRRVDVPGCWDVLPGTMVRPGPAWYRTRFNVPGDYAGRRAWLGFGAVSYHCRVFVNGRVAGEHAGLWDSFNVEITEAVTPGAEAELLLRVEKPASLSAGPASAALPGTFPLKQTLSGFLPYVWGQIFGGVWQEVGLYSTGSVYFGDVFVSGDASGRVTVTAETSEPADVTIEIVGPDGQVCVVATGDRRPTPALERSEGTNDQRPTTSHQPPATSHQPPATSDPAERRPTTGDELPRTLFDCITVRIDLPHPRPWSPAAPAMYTAVLRIANGDERVVRFGLRTLEAGGPTIRLNGQPLYPRMALSWGWYAAALHSNPGPAQVRADLLKLKALGYNGVKLCLWFPPQYYFDLADELGMLLWVELPMWLPDPSPFFRHQTPIEYERLVRLARNHPSVIIYSLGCELNRAAGADLLGPLYQLVKRLGGDGLVRDNSGSGEAYGGLLDEYADYYDHHFYSEPHLLRELIDYFSPRWRAPQPWLFGEFCDYDTLRDLRKLMSHREHREHREKVLDSQHPPSVSPPDQVWWSSTDPQVNPQGARWQMDLPHHEERLRANGLWERGAELERISIAHGLLHRKLTIELVRAYREISGYVITGEADTPIATAGMLDDQRALKYDSESFRAFNADTVLLAGWGKRRAWVAGGDRAARWDPWSYNAGAIVRPHLVVSHYGAATGPAEVRWTVTLDGEAGPEIASGTLVTGFAVQPGDVRELAVAEFTTPEVAAPRRAWLRAEVRIAADTARNEWPLWFFPRDPWAGLAVLALLDPPGRLADLPPLAPHIGATENTENTEITEGTRPTISNAVPSATHVRVMIATAWTPALRRFVERGGRAVLLQAGAGPRGPLRAVALPFWREALRLCEPHPAWGDFPHDNWAATQFLACATDYALDTAGKPGITPILRRIDTRTMAVHDYAVELPFGDGRLIVTTLRFDGGQGEQPLGISRSPAANYLLACWVRYLAQPGGQ